MADDDQFQGRRLFISYPRGGHAHAWAERVQAHFEAAGAEAWRDESSIREGEQNWVRRIEDALDRADLVLAVIADDSAHCAWQERELLRAVTLGKPVLALRIGEVSLPLCIQEKQAVELRGDDSATLGALSAAAAALVGEARSVQGPAPCDATADGIPAAQRRAECDYLNGLIHQHYSDREARYIPLEGKETQSLSLERALKSVRMDTEAVLQAFGLDEAPAAGRETRSYEDVLDAYRDLGQRAVRRLAVLGEPGAGKSFSLERIAVEYAQSAVGDPGAPLPLLAQLGRWTREAETLEAFIERTVAGVGRYLPGLRDQKRAVLLLDAINEIPPGQRQHKAAQIKDLAADERFAAVVVSCREKDFAEVGLPFDTLTLQPLKPPRIHEFLQRLLGLLHGRDATAEADALFWRIAGGPLVESAYNKWEAAGVAALFWGADEIPRKHQNVYASTTVEENAGLRAMRHDPRSLLRLARNPYLLQVMATLRVLPQNRAQLFKGFLRVLFKREQNARAKRNELASVPDEKAWLEVLAELAGHMQHQEAGADEGAQTSLPRANWPAVLNATLLDFSRDASVLDLRGDDLRFSHQLLQEYLASDFMRDASAAADRPASVFWPAVRWWQRNGWEVVAEIAGESCDGDPAALVRLIAWLAEANPAVAADVCHRLGDPAPPAAVLEKIGAQWNDAMLDIYARPDPAERAAIGRALGRFGLDRRRGVGLRADGLPDIDWVEIPGPAPFVYQEDRYPGLPRYWIARYPVTNAQYQAFVDAGGYRESRWWQGLHQRFDAPATPMWDEANAPRERVSWFEAVAFCRWLAEASGESVTLPTEKQWERSARGLNGRKFPWGDEYAAGRANCTERAEEGSTHLGRTSAVGLYLHASSMDGVLDLAGNVWEWCLNEYKVPANASTEGKASRVLRGGSWDGDPEGCRAAGRYRGRPDLRGNFIGFRACRGSPIDPLATAPRDAESPNR